MNNNMNNDTAAVIDSTPIIPNFFEPVINSDMLAKNINAYLREVMVGIVISNTASIRRVNMSEYERLIAEANKFSESSKIIALKDDKLYKTFNFINDDVETMKALQELFCFFVDTNVYYEDKCDTIFKGKPYHGFYYKADGSNICVVCYNNNEVPIDF